MDDHTLHGELGLARSAIERVREALRSEEGAALEKLVRADDELVELLDDLVAGRWTTTPETPLSLGPLERSIQSRPE